MSASVQTARYQWKVGDIFSNGKSRWQVIDVHGEKAVLRSCSTSWATTRPLTFDEWNDGRWGLETEVSRLQRERDELVQALREMVALYDRTDDLLQPSTGVLVKVQRGRDLLARLGA